eukprot:g80704.t1
MNERAEAKLAGYCGVGICSIAMLVVVYRAMVHFSGDYHGLSRKQGLHLLLIFGILLQMISYSSYITIADPSNPGTAFTYGSHILGEAIFVTAYTLFMTLWMDIMRFKPRWKRAFTVGVWLFNTLNLVSALFFCFEAARLGVDDAQSGAAYSTIFYVSILSLTVITLGFLGYGMRIRNTWKRYRLHETHSHLLRMLVFVVFVCCLCCLLRSVMLLVLWLNLRGVNFYVDPNKWPIPVWLLLSQWLPDFGLVSVMCWMTQTPDRTADDESWTDSRAPLTGLPSVSVGAGLITAQGMRATVVVNGDAPAPPQLADRS